MERLGVFPGSAIVLLAAGVVLIGTSAWRTGGFGWVKRVSPAHALRAAPLFVLYMACMNGAVGLAESRTEAIAAGLANYIWPTMILVFSVVLLKRRPRPGWLAAGVALAFGGIVAATSVTTGGLGAFTVAVGRPALPVLLGLVAGVAWGLYSVLGRAYPQAEPIGALGLFLLCAGCVTAALGAAEWGRIDPAWPAIPLALYLIFFPTSLAYSLWGVAMQRGDVATLAAASNLIPVFSAGLAVAVLGVPWRWELAVGAVLVSLGAAVARLAFRGPKRRGETSKSAPQ
jgi:drug/metabolite transporter (DMT)-like permease